MGLVDLPILLGLLSAFFGAITNILAKAVMGFSKTKDYIAINFGVIFIIFLPFSLKYFLLETSVLSIGLIVTASLVDGWANYFYFKSFEKSDPGTVSGLLSLSPLFALALLPLFTQITRIQIQSYDPIGVILTILGVIALYRAINLENQAWSRSQQKIPILMVPLISSLLFGVNVYLIKYIFSEHMTNPSTYYLIRALVIMVMMFLLFPPNLRWVTKGHLWVTSFRAIFVILKWMCLLYALDMGNPAVVKSISEVTPLFVLILAMLFFKEKLTRAKIIGSMLVVAGLLLISF